MIFILAILLIITASGAKAAPIGEFMHDYNSKEKSTMVKGLFVMLILISHFSQYVTLKGVYNTPYLELKNHLNQMVVAAFLFYSGYGIMESITKKGFSYVKTLPSKRFLSVLLNLDIAVVLFLIVQFFLGKTFELKTILLSLFGWGSVRNSNWYIFVILVLYLLIFISFLFLKFKNNKLTKFFGTVLLLILTILFVYSQMLLKRPAYSYNTAILLPLGCFYSLFKPQIEKIVMKNGYFYSFFCLIILITYLYFYTIRFKSIYAYSIWAISFTLLMVLFTMKISISNPILEWFGNHVFSIYMLQRIPMLILSHYGLNQSHKFVFLIISLFATCFMAMVFDFFTGKLANFIWKNKKSKNIGEICNNEK